MAIKLTGGAIKNILDGAQVDKPILQVLGYKKIVSTGSTADRYRLLLSDGLVCHPFSMLGAQLNHFVTSGQLERYTIIRAEKHVSNVIQGDKKLLIVLDLTVLAGGEDIGEKIGNPVQLQSGGGSDNASGNQQPSEGAGKNFGNGLPNRMGAPQSHAFGQGGLANSSVQKQNIHPIDSLTPYQNKWTIRARVTNKSAIRTWSNSRGEGKLFNMDLLDESGEIRACAFNDQCDKFYNMIEVNKVYYISKATLKTANKNFSSIKNDYEMSFNNDTSVEPCQEMTASIPMVQFDFVQINQLERVEKDALVDIIGICKNTGDVQSFISRNTNKELKKRELQLVDKSNTQVTLTLWGNEAENFDGSSNPVLAIKGTKVSDFGGRSLSMLNSSMLQINPDIREAHILRGWYDREGCQMESSSISNKVGGASGVSGIWKTFAQAKGEMLGMGEKPDYFTTKATVVMVRKDNCMYMACPSEECNKKVIDMNTGMYRCEKCNREYDSFKWRLLLSVSLADISDNQWTTCFQESAEALLGAPSNELGTWKETDENKFNEVIADANFKSYIFRLRTKMETFNEEQRLKTTVFSAVPVDYVKYGQKLLSDIKQMESVI